MIIETEKGSFEVDLYDSDAARELVKNLPQEISMSRWGDEFYGSLNKKVECGGERLRDVFEIGEVAIWPDGNALCIFFGPTPASRGEEPRMISPGAGVGKIKGDAVLFRDFGTSLKNVKLRP